MAKNVTLANLRTLARLEADFVNSQFFSDSDVNLLINRSADQFYNLVVASDEDYYRSSSTISLVSGTDSYTLPADFFKVARVRAQIGSSPNFYEEILRFNDSERDYYSISAATIPTMTVLLEYIPARADLVNDSDTMDFINGFDELVITDAAIKMKDREESDTNVLMTRKNELINQLEATIKDRDMANPSVTTDVMKQHSRIAPWSAASFLRYKVTGNNIIFVSYVAPWF